MILIRVGDHYTCHKAFDGTAILAGGTLIPYAFELLANSYGDEPAIGLELCRILAQTAGAEKLVGGQMEDLLVRVVIPTRKRFPLYMQTRPLL